MYIIKCVDFLVVELQKIDSIMSIQTVKNSGAPQNSSKTLNGQADKTSVTNDLSAKLTEAEKHPKDSEHFTNSKLDCNSFITDSDGWGEAALRLGIDFSSEKDIQMNVSEDANDTGRK